MEATKLFISLCKKYENDFENGIKKYIWGKIANELSRTLQIQYSVQQCDTKWKGLKNMYKQVKQHNEKSGNDPKVWQYYDLMDEVLFNRPEIKARATCSSKNGLIINGTHQHNEDDQLGNFFLVSKNFSSQNEKKICLMGFWNLITANFNIVSGENVGSVNSNRTFNSSFMRKRTNNDNAVERRHREKMARQDRYLDLLDRLTTAIEKK